MLNVHVSQFAKKKIKAIEDPRDLKRSVVEQYRVTLRAWLSAPHHVAATYELVCYEIAVCTQVYYYQISIILCILLSMLPEESHGLS